MNAQSIGRPPSGLSARQWSVRRRASGRSLRHAVRLAAFVFFRFTHRRKQGNALWSAAEHVWLGSETFLYWAMFDTGIDIPCVVATAEDAPETPDELCERVRAELALYWADQMASLPRRERPAWLPLP